MQAGRTWCNAGALSFRATWQAWAGDLDAQVGRNRTDLWRQAGLHEQMPVLLWTAPEDLDTTEVVTGTLSIQQPEALQGISGGVAQRPGWWRCGEGPLC